MKYYFDRKKLSTILEYVELTLASPSEMEVAIAAGYPKKDFDNAKKLYEKAMVLKQMYDVANGRKLSATDAVNETVELVIDHYAPVKEIAKVLFEDNREAISILALKGQREDAFDLFAVQASKLFKGLLGNDDYLAAIGKKGVSKEYLEKGAKYLKDMLELKRIQQLATKDKTRALQTLVETTDGLSKWYNQAYKIIKAYSKMPVAK